MLEHFTLEQILLASLRRYRYLRANAKASRFPKDSPRFSSVGPLSPDSRKSSGGGAALNTLSDFFETFGFIIPDALLHRRPPGANSRQRRFTVHVTLWAFLAQTLAPKYSAGSSSTAASTKARQRPKGCTQEEFDALPTSLRSQTPRQIQTS